MILQKESFPNTNYFDYETGAVLVRFLHWGKEFEIKIRMRSKNNVLYKPSYLILNVCNNGQDYGTIRGYYSVDKNKRKTFKVSDIVNNGIDLQLKSRKVKKNKMHVPKLMQISIFNLIDNGVFDIWFSSELLNDGSIGMYNELCLYSGIDGKKVKKNYLIRKQT